MSSGDNATGWSTVPLIINGKDFISETSFPVDSPSNSEKLWSGSSASIKDATRAVDAAQAAFTSWSQTKPGFRRDIMFRAADLFISRKEELFAYQAQETGAGRQFMEININGTAQILRDIGGRIEAAVEGSVPATAEQESHAIVVKEPYGVVLAIAPWYVCITLAFGPPLRLTIFLSFTAGMPHTCSAHDQLRLPSQRATQQFSRVPS
jgi:acyl-CoA reductase-like NAD-dependent aldehyde dehydrogenase